MIAIIKYNAGNIMSVQNALTRLGVESEVTDDKNTILGADKVIFPGVGEASTAMAYLKNKGLDDTIKAITNPFLGICLGLQLMCDFSEEGETNGLGIFNTIVKQFPKEDKVPHMGWNNFEELEGKLFDTIKKEDDVYYVHSYYAELCNATKATCSYIKTFSAVLQSNNYYATQFHPEKSADVGNRILKNFMKL